MIWLISKSLRDKHYEGKKKKILNIWKIKNRLNYNLYSILFLSLLVKIIFNCKPHFCYSYLIGGHQVDIRVYKVSIEDNMGPSGGNMGACVGHMGPLGCKSMAIRNHFVTIGGHRMVIRGLMQAWGCHIVEIWGPHCSIRWLQGSVGYNREAIKCQDLGN